MKVIFFLLVFSLPQLIYCATYRVAGKIAKVRGQVTVLSPGELVSRKLKEGDFVKEDSSIVTQSKSFAQVKFLDGSMINIGPNSKTVIVQYQKSGDGIVTLLKGKMRSNIVKNEKGTKKFFIQTRSAAMAVRGTEFEAMYNPDNKVSSLLTYKGEVAISKTSDLVVDDKPVKELVEEAGKVVLRDQPRKSYSEMEKMKKMVSTKDAVVVKGGQFSTTVKKIDTVSLPVKISPVQLNTLYKNKEYKEKTIKDVRPSSLKLNKKFAIKSAKQDAPLEGVVDLEAKKYAPKAGGFLDINTGLYVAPGDGAKFNEKLKVYEAKNIGDIDRNTGQYAPPKGLKLVADKGFVVDKVNMSAGATVEALEEKKKKLNGAIGEEFIVRKEVKKKVIAKNIKKEEFYKKNIVTLQLRSFGGSLEYANDTYTGATNKYEDVEGKSAGLHMRFASNNHWQTFAAFTVKDFDFPVSSFGSTNQLWDLEGGVYYSLKPRIDIMASFSLDQRLFLNHVSSGSTVSTTIKEMTLPKLNLGVSGSFARSHNWSADYLGRFSYVMARDGGLLTTDSGMELHLEVLYKYWLFTNLNVDFSFFTNTQKVSVTGSSQTFSADATQSGSGLGLALGFIF